MWKNHRPCNNLLPITTTTTTTTTTAGTSIAAATATNTRLGRLSRPTCLPFLRKYKKYCNAKREKLNKCHYSYKKV